MSKSKKEQRWRIIRCLLLNARNFYKEYPIGSFGKIPIGTLSDTLAEFDEFFIYNEYELAWHSLWKYHRKGEIDDLFRETMLVTAKVMKLKYSEERDSLYQ